MSIEHRKSYDPNKRNPGFWKQTAYLGMPAEEEFGYAQAIRIGDTVHVSGQAGLDEQGKLVSPVASDAGGRPIDFSAMESQMRQTYLCAQTVLAKMGASLDDVVSETLFVLDVPTAYAAAVKVRKEIYRTSRPQVASNLIGVSGLAFPGQVIEIAFVAACKTQAFTNNQ